MQITCKKAASRVASVETYAAKLMWLLGFDRQGTRTSLCNYMFYWGCCLVATHMVAPVDKELAQVTANKASSTSHKHSVALYAWLGLDNSSSGKTRRLYTSQKQRADGLPYYCNCRHDLLCQHCWECRGHGSASGRSQHNCRHGFTDRHAWLLSGAVGSHPWYRRLYCVCVVHLYGPFSQPETP